MQQTDIQLGHTRLLPSEAHLLCYFVVFNCEGTCFRLRRELRDIVSMVAEKMGCVGEFARSARSGFRISVAVVCVYV